MLTKKELEKLRKEIVLNSIYLADYDNSFGIDRDDVYTFFDGFVGYMYELMEEKEHNNYIYSIDDIFNKYDNIDNLYEWYLCFEDDPLPIKKYYIDDIIHDIKEINKSVNRAWVRNEDGTIKNDVFLIDVLDVLEDLKEFETPYNIEKLEEFIETTDNIKWFNTYNWNANISNNLNYGIYETKNNCYIILRVHRFGDVRCNYTDWIVLEFTNEYYFYELEEFTDCKIVYGDWIATINAFKDTIELYNSETYESFETCNYELNDILEDIQEYEDNL